MQDTIEVLRKGSFQRDYPTVLLLLLRQMRIPFMLQEVTGVAHGDTLSELVTLFLQAWMATKEVIYN